MSEPENGGVRWSGSLERVLTKLWILEIPTVVIADVIGTTPAAISTRASKLRLPPRSKTGRPRKDGG